MGTKAGTYKLLSYQGDLAILISFAVLIVDRTNQIRLIPALQTLTSLIYLLIDFEAEKSVAE